MTRIDRREFLRTSATSLGSLIPVFALSRPAQDTVTSQTPAPAGKLWDPGRVTAVQPVTAADNDAAIQAIEKQLRCTCGCGLDVYTCRTTDFTCQYSPALHRHVLELAQAGLSPRAIVARFVSDSGISILMAPPKRGFNLTGYYLPATAMVTAAVLLFLAMRRWVRHAPAPVASPDSAAPTASPEELARLREALQHTDA